jgi:uncharacterized membrane protein HdeD (DUF308 family)
MNGNHSSSAMAWRLLYCTYIVMPIAAGADKFFNFLVAWPIYLNMRIPLLLGITPETCMYATGIIEIAAGLLVFFKPRVGGLVVAAWLVAIALNLMAMGQYYDIAVRDLGLAAGAFTLVLLSRELNK